MLLDPPRRSGNVGGVWHANVTKIVAGGAYVEVPRLVAGRQLGPAQVLQGPWTPLAATETASPEATSSAGGTPHTHAHAHTHGLGLDLAVGDRVIVAFLEGSVDRPVILGRLA